MVWHNVVQARVLGAFQGPCWLSERSTLRSRPACAADICAEAQGVQLRG